MILQALNGYYRRLAQAGGSDVAPEGFERKAIPFLLIVDRCGNFVDFQDTREGEGKKRVGRMITVPKGVKKTSGIAANLLWDTPNYVLGIPKPDPKKSPEELIERAREQRGCFTDKIRSHFPSPITDDGVAAVLAFLDKGDVSAVLAHPAWNEIEETAPLLTFRLDGDIEPVCQRSAVIDSLTKAPAAGLNSTHLQHCLVTGDYDESVRLHTSIKGVWGAQSSGANIISFNLDPFCSYGKQQGDNAPVGKRAEFAYTTALNSLLTKGSRQKISVGNSTVVFWAEQQNPLEDLLADLFGEPSKENPDQLNAAVRALFASPSSGALPLDEDYTPFYVLGLAPNAARIAVRFWYPGTVGDTARHIKQHFADCSMVHGPKQPEHLSIFRLLVSIASLGKPDNIPPNLAGEFMKSILTGTQYPQTLLAAAVRRCRAEQEVTYPRAALIKACLLRWARSRSHQSNEQEVGMSLDTSNSNPGYRLGRLFATLEKIQEEASPGINATIRDRFYGSASSTPVAAFAYLMKLKNHHLAKLENRGRAVNLEKLIGEIVDGLDAFPAHLSLADQGLFAVGYYHQRQDFFKK